MRLLEARTLLLLGRLDEALAAATDTVGRATANADAVYLRGAVHIARRDFGAAEADLRRALTLAPDHTAAMSDLAALLEHLERYEEARELLEKALKLGPGDQQLREHLRRLEPAAGKD